LSMLIQCLAVCLSCCLAVCLVESLNGRVCCMCSSCFISVHFLLFLPSAIFSTFLPLLSPIPSICLVLVNKLTNQYMLVGLVHHGP
jgi:hypothetical protein